MVYKYSLQIKLPEEKVARAQGSDWNASYKDLVNVSNAIRKKSVAQAMQILQDVIELKKAIEFRRFGKGAGHKTSLGGRRGRFPKKESSLMLKLLANAVANAVSKGLNPDGLEIFQVAAYKQNVLPRYKKYFATGITLGYGKQSTRADYVTARAEIVLLEKVEKKQQPKTSAKKAEAKVEGVQKPKVAKKEKQFESKVEATDAKEVMAATA